MKKNGILLGAEVTVKMPYEGTADQIRGTITDVNTSTVTVTESLDEDQIKDGTQARVVVIPKSSAEVLAFHKNPNVPEAKAEEGILYVNGEAVRTGFDVIDIVATLANRVYLTAKVDDTDRVDVYSYDVAKDEFYKVTNEPLNLNLEARTEIGTSVMIPFLNTYKEEEKKPGADGTVETVEYAILEETGYLMISTESTYAAVIKTELFNSDILDSLTLGTTSAYFFTTSNIRVAGMQLDHSGNIEYGDEYGSGRIEPVEDGKIIIRAYNAHGRHLSLESEVQLDGEYVSAVIAGRTTVIKSTKEIYANVAGKVYNITDKTAIKELDDFNYVVKNEEKNGVLKLWFTNANAEIKVYSVSPAEDARGPIVDVK